MAVSLIWVKSMDTGRCIDKKELRRQGLKQRDSMPETERRQKSLQIQKNLLTSGIFEQAEQVLCYVHFRSEAETGRILEQTLAGGKELYCPRVCGKEMEFYRIYSKKDFVSGSYGILEPEASRERRFCPDNRKKALMIMPGAVFDREGFRIGYGGGFYDRYLAGLAEKGDVQPVRVVLLFSCQLVEHIPREEHDLAADFLVTEEGIFRSKS